MGIVGLAQLRLRTDFRDAILHITHDRRQQGAPAFIFQHGRRSAAHRGDQGIGGAQVDSDSQPVLVGIGT